MSRPPRIRTRKPDAVQGIYEGPIVATGRRFVLQYNINLRRYRHDRGALLGVVAVSETPVRIAYQAGSAAVTPLPPEEAACIRRVLDACPEAENGEFMTLIRKKDDDALTAAERERYRELVFSRARSTQFPGWKRCSSWPSGAVCPCPR